MARAFNFSAGPSALPEKILEEAATEMLDFGGTGMSVMEMSHRSPAFQAIVDDAEETLRRLMSIPDDYRVLFLQGGATLQFASVPMNLMRTGRAGYVVSGNWSKLAWREAQKYGEAPLVATSEEDGFTRTPEVPTPIDQDLDYLYVCQNETVFGTMMRELPDTGSVPLVADVSSMFLSCPLDVERYGLIFAGAQKNAGPAGTTVVICRDDLIGDGPALGDVVPTYMGYRIQADKGSLYNTPNCWGIYMCGKVFHWVEDMGGLGPMGERNWARVGRIYDFLDESSLFEPLVEKSSRSIANVTFRCPTPELDAAFVAGAREHGIQNIKGHRILGGMRASCYNAVPDAAIDALLAYMEAFEGEHGQAATSPR
jgi:phosphoserine aminotransferase